MEAIAQVSSEALGRHEEPQWHLDWSVDWGMLDQVFRMQITMVEQAKDQPYSALTEIRIIANEAATKRYLKFAEVGIDWFERGVMISMLADGTYDKDLRILLEDQFPKKKEIMMADPKLGSAFLVSVICRRLGEDTGRDILLDLGGQLRVIREAQRQAARKLTTEEIAKMKKIQASFDT